MKKIFLIVLLFLCSVSFAQHNGIGFGVVTGKHTGISVKTWVSKYDAIDIELSYSFKNTDKYTVIGIDYNKHLPFFGGPAFLYYGMGGKIKPYHMENSEEVICIRGTFGINLLGLDPFQTPWNIDVFFEIQPSFEIVPSTKPFVDVLFGARYFLN